MGNVTRRNLRRWAEAKRRREDQAALARGHWVYFADGVGIFIEEPWPPYGTYCAPTTFLPMCTEPPTPYLSRPWREHIWTEAQKERKEPNAQNG